MFLKLLFPEGIAILPISEISRLCEIGIPTNDIRSFILVKSLLSTYT